MFINDVLFSSTLAPSIVEGARAANVPTSTFIKWMWEAEFGGISAEVEFSGIYEDIYEDITPRPRKGKKGKKYTPNLFIGDKEYIKKGASWYAVPTPIKK
jgi:hypothetical protein